MTHSPGGGDSCGSAFGFSPEVTTSFATRPVAVFGACSASREAAAKAGSEPGAEWANEPRAQGRAMGQRRELSTAGRSHDKVRGRADHFDAASATVVKATRQEASAFLRAPAAARPGTDRAGLLSALLARAAHQTARHSRSGGDCRPEPLANNQTEP